MTPVIAFEHISKRFTLYNERRNTIQERIIGMIRPRGEGEIFWALRDVSFAVNAGQSFGLVGHNGAGKSTALKLMTRILEPTSGVLQIRGRVAALLELGSGFHPDLSGRENIFLYGSLMGISKHDMQLRLEEIVDFADIGAFLDTEIKHYSSGMYTRLAFAVATAVDPDILITDEVLAVGDEAFQRKCLDRIFSFRRAGKTIIFVSHALEVVRSLCDTAVWLDHGIARGVGPSGQIIDAYLNEVNRQEQERIQRTQQKRSQADSDEAKAAEALLVANRRGTREVEIVRVETRDSAGQVCEVFHTRDALTIRIYYHAKERINRPVFGVGLYHETGIWLIGPNTRFDEFEISEIEGDGYVEYTIPSLPLLGGRYAISVSAVHEGMVHLYDYHDRVYPLVVQSSGLRERYGILSLQGVWQWQPTKPKELDAAVADAASRTPR